MVSQVISRYKFTLAPFSNSDLKIMYSVVYSTMYLIGMLFFMIFAKVLKSKIAGQSNTNWYALKYLLLVIAVFIFSYQIRSIHIDSFYSYVVGLICTCSVLWLPI